ncbi:MAG: alpha/beta fold hydrolase [Thermoleophilaceae bacterium]
MGGWPTPSRIALLVVAVAALPVWVAPAHAAPCPSGARCGSVAVPRDRADPGGGQLQIAYQLLPHKKAGAVAGTIVPLTGGPGGSNTAGLDGWQLIFGKLLDSFDLLLIDARGTGSSGVIDCKPLQHMGFTRSNVEACATQLGSSRDFYRSSSVADDVDAVRAALGLDKIDVYGFSWGTVQARSYASRHGDHLRSLVMDSSGQNLDVVQWRASFGENRRRQLAVLCSRSTTCKAVGEDPVKRVAALAAALRKKPVSGTAYAIGGERVKVRATEAAVLVAAFPEVLSQVPAVARAFARGDRVPLVRFVAENGFTPAATDSGPPEQFSAGHAIASLCNDDTFPWDPASAPAARQQSWFAAFAQLPEATFSPFSAAAARDDPGGLEALCMFWPAPASREPPVTAESTYPPVPALFVSGDLDGAPVPVARALAAQFPSSTFVEPRNVGHGAAFSSECVRSILVRFVGQLAPGDTSCAANGQPDFGYSLFPLTARDETTPGRRLPGDHSVRADRLATSAAIETVEDVLVQPPTGHCLRGGTVKIEQQRPRLLLTACRFVRDIAVTGTVIFDPERLGVDATVQLRGRGTATGRLHLRTPGNGKPVLASGALGTHRIRLRIPVVN